MKLEDPPEDRRRFEIIGIVIAVVIAATAIGFFTLVILAADEPEGLPGDAATAATPTNVPGTPSPSPTSVVEGVALARPVEVRSGPATDFAIVTRLAITDPINVLGRSSDGRWLVVTPETRPSLTGWIPVDAITGVEVDPLPVVAAPGATVAAGSATLSPDLPDLVISEVFAQQNVLWVEVMNQGVTDATGELRVSVNGGPEVLLDVKPGEPLRPDQRLSAEVTGFYLQLRRNLEIHLLPIEGVEEEDLDNNLWMGTVSPDAPNDVEVVSAEVDDDTGLVVTLRNNSPIPIEGTFTVSVRETPPEMRLLGREVVAAAVEVGATVDLPFEELTEVDFTRVRVSVSTDAIEDAVIVNNTYPR